MVLATPWGLSASHRAWEPKCRPSLAPVEYWISSPIVSGLPWAIYLQDGDHEEQAGLGKPRWDLNQQN